MVRATLEYRGVSPHRRRLHLQLASLYDHAAAGGIGQGDLFRIESAVAFLTAALVLIRAGRATYLLAALVAGSALLVVLVYRYVDVPSFGPIPSMYEPVWYSKKLAATSAEAAGLLTAAAAVVWSVAHRRHPDSAVTSAGSGK